MTDPEALNRLLRGLYAPRDRVVEAMLTQEPLLDPGPFADAAGLHVEDVVPRYKVDRDRLIGEFWD